MTESIQVNERPAGALYYPFTTIYDEEWLKSALLYWGTVYRIIPHGMLVDDKAEVREAADAGDLRALSPSEPDIIATTTAFDDGFLSFLDNTHRREEILTRTKRIFAGEVKDIDVRKVGEGLISKLKREGLVTATSDGVRFHSNLGDLFMIYLASSMSDRNGQIPLITDSETFRNYGEFALFSDSQHVDKQEAIASYLAQVQMPWPAPMSLKAVGMERIISFISKYSEERSSFVNAVEQQMKLIGNMTSNDMRSGFIASVHQQIKKAGIEYRRAFALDLVDTALLTALTITTPLYILSSGSPLQPFCSSYWRTNGTRGFSARHQHMVSSFEAITNVSPRLLASCKISVKGRSIQ